MLKFESHIEHPDQIHESFALKMETDNPECINTILLILRLYEDREKIYEMRVTRPPLADDEEVAKRLKQYDDRCDTIRYKHGDVKKPESSGCGIVMTAKGPVMTK